MTAFFFVFCFCFLFFGYGDAGVVCIFSQIVSCFSSFAYIFFNSEGYLFVLFMVSFAVQKLLCLIRSHLFIFVFIFITLGGGSKRIMLGFMSKSVLPVVSSKSFIVSGLTFRSLIHSGLFLCMVIENVLISFF